MKHFLLSVAIAFSFAASANADFVVRITDDGTDMTLRATGSYDFSALTPSNANTFVGAPAIVQPNDDILGLNIGFDFGPADVYEVSYDGILSGGGSRFTNNVTTTNPFFLTNGPLGNSVFLQEGAPSIGTFNETAVFEGTTLADLGMVVGETVTITWEGDSGIITTAVVPEPSSAIIGFIGLVGLIGRRRR